MYALKTPFFRPASRPFSPSPPPAQPSRPDSDVSFERSRPLTRLSLTTFRRPSPAPAPEPARAPTATTLVQDGSYLEILSLKLSEAVSRAVAQPSGPPAVHELVSGRRPIPAGRGRALGSLIASELRAASETPHLYRAVLRSLHRPLSVLLGNLSASLLSHLSSPTLLALPSTAPQTQALNPIQLHAVAIATFAGELLETFDDFALGLDGGLRGDGLKHIREGLTSLVNRVVHPFLGLMKSELHPLVESLQALAISFTGKNSPSGKTSSHLHPSIVRLQTVIPAYSKAITRYSATPISQTNLATFLISIIWRGLLALTSRPYVAPTPPASPTSLPGVVRKRRGSYTYPPTSSPGRFAIKLPSSRPPSPPDLAVSSSVTADAQALYDILNQLPRPDARNADTRLAREAVDEAFDALKALPAFFDVVSSASPAHSVDDIVQQLATAAKDLPTLIALPTVLHVYGPSWMQSVPAMLGISDSDYRNGCLTGFGRAEECATAVGQRLLDILTPALGPGTVLCKWLEVELAEDPFPLNM
ncbi:uncharacterized protein EV420DRAFT_1538624 [Desarmillaria tabescens]|uniref:Uncharacterized protein n=1 Tax=Armillaria tabescens TaxID=1929756 RepID=A0AA39KE62_ARMTA|nr:uncharacterized protein EV420DRAFT_1538624 [Desarmillaria tabescens]KAK0459158.1 hypothetical protein EV420DRAFT_1538624 [Desarmillaria tabescens]